VFDLRVSPGTVYVFKSNGDDYDDGNYTTLINIEMTSSGEGNDTIYGSDRDEFFLDNGGTANIIDGGGGNDILSYTYDVSSIGIEITLVSGGTANAGGAATGDTILNIEGLSGTSKDDILTGDDGDNQLFGWSGNDTIVGGAGADVLAGEGGIDLLTGGDGLDIFWGTRDHHNGDTITDLSKGEQIVIHYADLSALDGTVATQTLEVGSNRMLNLTDVSGHWTAIYTPDGFLGAWITSRFGETPYDPKYYTSSDYTTLTYVD
jgi:Ca2+-binding RTX toxin-like protein